MREYLKIQVIWFFHTTGQRSMKRPSSTNPQTEVSTGHLFQLHHRMHYFKNVMFFEKDTGIVEYGVAGMDSYTLYVTTDGANTFMKVDLPAEIQGQIEKTEEYLAGTR